MYSKKKALVGALAAAAFISQIAASAAIAGEVNVLTWEGYADESFIKSFEEASGCKVSATYVGSNDDFNSAAARNSSKSWVSASLIQTHIGLPFSQNGCHAGIRSGTNSAEKKAARIGRRSSRLAGS